MKKNDYLSMLNLALRKANIADADEILSEYEQHFAFKLADGLTEEEIAARLESPDLVAANYMSISKGASTGKPGVKIAMGLLAVLEAMVYFIFFAWVVSLGAAAIASIALGGSLVLQISALSFLPQMPYLSAFMHGFALLALGAAFASGSCVCFMFLRQIVKASLRWHAIVTGKTALPTLPWVPQPDSAAYRRLKKVLIISLLVLGVSTVLGFVIAALQAGAFGYWHAWGWFVG